MDSYDRRAAGSDPFHDLETAGTHLNAAVLQVSEAHVYIRAVYVAMAKQLKDERPSLSPAEKTTKANYDYSMELRDRTEKMLKDLKTLAEAYKEAVSEFR